MSQQDQLAELLFSLVPANGNAKGGFGIWCWDVAFEPAKVHDIVAAHAH